MASKPSAVPSHLRPKDATNGADFQRKHHGKTQSHVVSARSLLPSPSPSPSPSPTPALSSDEAVRVVRQIGSLRTRALRARSEALDLDQAEPRRLKLLP